MKRVMHMTDTAVVIPYLYASGELRFDLPLQWGPDQQIFSHMTRDGQEQRHVDVAKLHRLIAAKPFRYGKVEVGITSTDAEQVRTQNGVETVHLRQISPQRLEVPGIMLRLSDGTDIIVDGNHRFVKRYLLGLPSMRFWAITEDQLRPCLLAIDPEYGATLTDQSKQHKRL